MQKNVRKFWKEVLEGWDLTFVIVLILTNVMGFIVFPVLGIFEILHYISHIPYSDYGFALGAFILAIIGFAVFAFHLDKSTWKQIQDD